VALCVLFIIGIRISMMVCRMSGAAPTIYIFVKESWKKKA
jgi:hypothetical protein